MKFILNPKLILGCLVASFIALSSCSKSGESPNNSANNNGNSNQTIPAPTIESMQPTQAFAGDTVSVNGANYSTAQTENSVKFNGTDATLISATSTQLKVKVPQNGTTGQISVKVKNSAYVTSSFVFTYLSPVTVSSISPIEAAVGKTVTITGTNFSTSLTANTVSFNGTLATVTNATPTQLTVTVPQGATSGPITVTVNKHVATSQAFKVTVLPLSTWQEISAPDPTGDLVIAAAVGDVVLYTNIRLDNVLFTSNLYKINNGVVSNIYNSAPYNIGSVFALTNSTNAAYLLSDQGIFRSEDGSTWKFLTPGYGSGEFYTGVVTKGDQLIVYNRTHAYTSTDKGVTWNTQTFSNPNAVITSGTYEMPVYSGEAANNYYYSVPLVDGGNMAINKSTDGITWTTTQGIQGGYFYSYGYHDILAASGDNVFCVYSPNTGQTADSKRLYKSTDHGDTWTMVANEKVNTVKAFGNYVIYGYDSINMSTDNGNTFTKYAIPSGYIIGGLQKAGSYLYIFCSNGSTHKIFRSSL